jgi:hypothetical protein
VTRDTQLAVLPELSVALKETTVVPAPHGQNELVEEVFCVRRQDE